MTSLRRRFAVGLDNVLLLGGVVLAVPIVILIIGVPTILIAWLAAGLLSRF